MKFWIYFKNHYSNLFTDFFSKSYAYYKTGIIWTKDYWERAHFPLSMNHCMNLCYGWPNTICKISFRYWKLAHFCTFYPTVICYVGHENATTIIRYVVYHNIASGWSLARFIFGQKGSLDNESNLFYRTK